MADAIAGHATTLTVVRASWFAQNFSEGFFRDDLLAGEVALPVGDVREPFIDIDDIADVVTAALIDPRHAGQVYEVTGPRLLTFREAVDEIADASGRVITTVPVTVTAYLTAMTDAGVPQELTELMAYLFTEVLDGRNASIGDGVQRALGRPARDFTEFARTAAAAGAFDGGVEG